MQYSITYVIDQDAINADNVSTYTIEDQITLQNASKEGYEFDGWYLDEACTMKVEAINSGSMGNLILYSKWIENGGLEIAR